MHMSPPALPCSVAEPCPVLSFVWPPAVGWLWITSVSVAHRIRWDGGFKNKMDPIINKEKTPVMHPVNYPLSTLEDNIKMGTKQTRAQQLLKQRQVPVVPHAWGLCQPVCPSLCPSHEAFPPQPCWVLLQPPQHQQMQVASSLHPPTHPQLQIHPSTPSSKPVLTWSWQGPEVCKTRTLQVLG